MMIHKLLLLLKHWDTQLHEPTNQIQINVPNVVKPTNKKMLPIIKLWGIVENKNGIVVVSNLVVFELN